MAAVVRTARLNAVASMLWRAETTGASDLLDGPRCADRRGRGGRGVPDLTACFRTGGGTWAEEYLSVGSHIERRLELLATALGRSDRLGAMEAEVIVAKRCGARR
jgi:hypothetical protein